MSASESRKYWEKCENCGDSKIMCRKYRVQPTHHYRTTMSGMTQEEKRQHCQPLPQIKSSKAMCDRKTWRQIL